VRRSMWKEAAWHMRGIGCSDEIYTIGEYSLSRRGRNRTWHPCCTRYRTWQLSL
jgi:hypothetical protein